MAASLVAGIIPIGFTAQFQSARILRAVLIVPI
jgi:hypothetical protein